MNTRASMPLTGRVVGPSRTERFKAAERRLTAVGRLMDEAVGVPGTSFRFGLDPVLGLIPWVGDLLSAGVGLWIILEASRLDVPRVVLARMVFNTLVDLAIGAVPILGDVFDFAIQSNRANLELFRRYAGEPTSSTGGQTRFFLGLMLVVLGVVWLMAQALGWLLSFRIPTP